MKRILPLLIFALLCRIGSSQEDLTELRQIVQEIDSYRGKAVTMNLKFKNCEEIEGNKYKVFSMIVKFNEEDITCERILFYDRKNHDIAFDLVTDDIWEKVTDSINNLHEGMDYAVSFTVKDVDSLGRVVAEVIGFQPVIMSKIPEKGSP